MLLDIATVAVLGFVGFRLVGGMRIALARRGRSHVAELVRGLRPRHFLLAPVALAGVLLAAGLLLQIPGMQFGWWTAIGGLGNPVTGTTDRTAGTALEWIVPLVFLTLLVPALPLFAEAEERRFRYGSEYRSRRQRMLKAAEFGLVHALIGIPVGVALALGVGGWYFTLMYMRAFRRNGGDAYAATEESTRAHLAYNAEIVPIVLLVVLTVSR